MGRRKGYTHAEAQDFAVEAPESLRDVFASFLRQAEDYHAARLNQRDEAHRHQVRELERVILVLRRDLAGARKQSPPPEPARETEGGAEVKYGPSLRLELPPYAGSRDHRFCTATLRDADGRDAALGSAGAREMVVATRDAVALLSRVLLCAPRVSPADREEVGGVCGFLDQAAARIGQLLDRKRHWDNLPAPRHDRTAVPGKPRVEADAAFKAPPSNKPDNLTPRATTTTPTTTTTPDTAESPVRRGWRKRAPAASPPPPIRIAASTGQPDRRRKPLSPEHRAKLSAAWERRKQAATPAVGMSDAQRAEILNELTGSAPTRTVEEVACAASDRP